MRTVIICTVLLMMQLVSFSQETEYVYTKEKVYLHTNHVFFKPGEQVFFKIYVVNGTDQTPSTISNVVYVDVINPSGNVIQKLNYKVENGYTEGSYDINEAAPGGIYKLRAYTTWMRNEKESIFFTKELTVQKVIAPRILMKLDFPRKGYGAGDEVVADFSMRSLDNLPIRSHEGKFTVSIAGTEVETVSFKTDHEGKSQLKFHLPSKLSSNDGLLNVTVNYDAFTEAVSRSIPIVLNKIDLQFMPEGGHMISGIKSIIAFKAVNEHGKPADVKGNILDASNRVVASFESYQFGMGKLSFEPKAGQVYKAVITSPKNISTEYKLPDTRSMGVLMNITHDDKDIKLKLYSTNSIETKLVVQTKTVTHFTANYELEHGENEFIVPEHLFPIGITQFTLYTSTGMPLSERLVFTNKDKQLKVSVTTDKQQYLPREKVVMKIATTDANGKPVPSNLSLSVIDDKLWSFADDKQDHVLSWLLMTSELRGKIEEPPFYFKKDEPKAEEALDLVMLTHGYRYFDYIEYVQKNGQLQFTPDLQAIVSGVVLNGKGEPVRSDVYLVNTHAAGKALKLTTGKDGVFFFSDLAPSHSYSLIAKSVTPKDNIQIKILQNGTGYNPLQKDVNKQLGTNDKFIATVRARPQQKMPKPEEVNLQINLRNDVASIDEVVVVAYGTQRKASFTASVSTIRGSELATTPLIKLNNALAGKVAGVMVTPQANPMKTNISIRGFASVPANNQPLIVVNGVPTDDLNLSLLNPNDIESVEVVKDASATAIYGSRAANGLIIINSKRAGRGKISFDISKKKQYAWQSFYANHMSYSYARKFYAPVYQSVQTEERNDFRETIYWNPVVQTNKDGTATLEFYNSDATTTFRTIAEGIGYNGVPGRTEHTYAAANALSVDVKIPPYLTTGDRALLPLVIKNNSQQSQQLSVEIQVPENFVTENNRREITLAVGRSQQLLIPVIAQKATKGNIRIVITGSQVKETIIMPVEAGEKGFPVITTMSGDAPGNYSFNVKQLIPGTMQAQVKLYRSLEGQLLDGIESMLREPYGCFEQTSSTTYPNVFVLKYLRESGKSNPEIENKALGYIERGYKRLVGFETKENGFEWFGNSPAHEALTAYGLLEFTDMQDIIKVDKAMLQRTKNFLLDRRDGKGGFTISSGGYDRFASVPNKVAGIYIVYALTQAGMGKEIEREYKAAVSGVLESNDGYLLSMMALAAHNMKDMDSYGKLMQRLDENYGKKQLNSETSVVNSRDASLKVETRALYAMALMRNVKCDLVKVAELISSILMEKTYYGYGSTQSTVLALQAIVQYSKLIGKAIKETQVQYTVNDRSMQNDSMIPTAIKEGGNNFGITFKNKEDRLPYSFEVSYNTYTPPNSEKAVLLLSTSLADSSVRMGETVRMNINVTNTKDELQPMAVTKIGIPAGLSAQPWQLKELMEKNQVTYYEIFDNYLVFYWMGFAKGETKSIRLDLKADVPGRYRGKAGNAYLYYTPEHKHWNDGLDVNVLE